MVGDPAVSRELHVLVVDGDDSTRSALGEVLRRHGYAVADVRSATEALERVRTWVPDLVVVDLLLPDLSGLELVDELEGLLPESFFLLVTGHASIDSATRAVRSSVVGYLTKPLDVERLLATARRVGERRDLAALHHRLQDGLARAKERWEKTFDAIPDPIAIARSDGTVVQVNRAFATRFGRSQSGTTDLELLFGDDAHPLGRTARSTALSGGPFLDETSELSAEGTFSYACYPLELEDGPGVIHLLRDVAEQRRAEDERRRLELQIEKVHRVESIGRLAGGVAHDFNNLLTVILGNLELAEIDSVPGTAQERCLAEARKAASRAAELTQQLVTFARRQRTGDASVAHSTLDLNQLLSEVRDLLQRTLGEDVELVLRTEPELWPVEADAAQMTQVLLNLAANARDAMPDGGTLTVETRNRVLDWTEETTLVPHLSAGDYVELVVSDTGIGIPPEVRPHLFEPFFTTKEVGAGSGLGLATTYGIVTRAGGAIQVRSPAGGGASFVIHMPRTEPTTPLPLEAASVADVGGSETILLVEDDDAVRNTAVPGLVALGYRVLAAGSAQEALEVLGRKRTEVDILVTDIVMPGLNGFELAERVRRVPDTLPVLFVSGYPYDALESRRGFDADAPWLTKPYSARELAAKVREVLDR